MMNKILILFCVVCFSTSSLFSQAIKQRDKAIGLVEDFISYEDDMFGVQTTSETKIIYDDLNGKIELKTKFYLSHNEQHVRTNKRLYLNEVDQEDVVCYIHEVKNGMYHASIEIKCINSKCIKVDTFEKEKNNIPIEKKEYVDKILIGYGPMDLTPIGYVDKFINAVKTVFGVKEIKIKRVAPKK